MCAEPARLTRFQGVLSNSTWVFLISACGSSIRSVLNMATRTETCADQDADSAFCVEIVCHTSDIGKCILAPNLCVDAKMPRDKRNVGSLCSPEGWHHLHRRRVRLRTAEEMFRR